MMSAGVRRALLAALLFGASAPFAKLLLARGGLSPVVLAGTLYLGSGLGLALWRGWKKQWSEEEAKEAPLRRADWPWLAAAIAEHSMCHPGRPLPHGLSQPG